MGEIAMLEVGDGGGHFLTRDWRWQGRDGMILAHTSSPIPYPSGEWSDERSLGVWVGEASNLPRLAGLLGVSPHDSGRLWALAWRRWGESLPQRLEGVVAGAVWDSVRKEAFVWRDPLGMIPILVVQGSGAAAERVRLVSSDPVLPLAYVPTPLRVNPVRMRGFLSFSGDVGREDVVQGVNRLRPGERMSWRLGVAPEYAWHWNPDLAPISEPVETLAPVLWSKIAEAVARIPGVSEAACTLSGGLDSTVVCAALARYRGLSGSSGSAGRIPAFSWVSPRFPSCDESTVLPTLARALPIDLHTVEMDGLWPLFQPQLYGDSGVMGPYGAWGLELWGALLTRVKDVRGSDLVLTGFGGNYAIRTRPKDRWCSQLGEASSWREWSKGFVHPPGSRRRLISELAGDRLSEHLGAERYGRVARLWRRPGPPELPWLRAENWLTGSALPEVREPAAFAAWRLQGFRDWQWELIVRYLYLLSRKHGVRLRDPLLDVGVQALSLGVPAHLHFNNRGRRFLWGRMAAMWLPATIVERKKTQSFTALGNYGLAHGARAVGDDLLSDSAAAFSLIEVSAAREAYAAYCAYCQRHGWGATSHQLVWALLSAQLWQQAMA